LSASRRNSTTARLLVPVIKYAVALSILVYLFFRAASDESFHTLSGQAKDWPLLFAALGLGVTASLTSFLRLYLLARGLHLPITILETVRLGFVGILFNYLALGVMGGDTVKAIFLARHRPGRRTEAVVSVFVDRAIGVFALFCLVSCAFLTIDFQELGVRDSRQFAAVRTLCWVTLGFTVVGACGIGGLTYAVGFRSPSWHAVRRIPRLAAVAERLWTALQIYRGKRGLLATAFAMSLGVHTCVALSVYLVACGLPGEIPSLGVHFVAVPIANLAALLPLPGGMGAYEYALDSLYHSLSSVAVAERQGFVVALGYRMITLVIALIGAVCYLGSRDEMSQLMKSAEQNEVTSGQESVVVHSPAGTGAVPGTPHGACETGQNKPPSGNNTEDPEPRRKAA
jgi:uncharacterized protein (TIRG00374 family)